MLLTIFLAIVFCAAITLMLLSAVAFIQKKEFFSSENKYNYFDHLSFLQAIIPRINSATAAQNHIALITASLFRKYHNAASINHRIDRRNRPVLRLIKYLPVIGKII